MTESMIEKCCRSLAIQNKIAQPDGKLPSGRPVWTNWEDDVRAVLRTLKEPDEGMTTAFMREFEKWTPLLRYKETDKWHTTDIIGVRHSLAAAISHILKESESK